MIFCKPYDYSAIRLFAMTKYSEIHAAIQNCYETLCSLSKAEPKTIQVYRGLNEKYSYHTVYQHLRQIKAACSQSSETPIVDSHLIKNSYQALLSMGLIPTHYKATQKLHYGYSAGIMVQMNQNLRLDKASLYHKRIETAYYGFIMQGIDPTSRQVRDFVDPTLSLSRVGKTLRIIAGKPRKNTNNKVSYAEVYQTFMDMHTENKAQTVNAIRVRLGKGSPLEVGKHLQEVKEKYPGKIVHKSKITRLHQDITLAYEKLSAENHRPSAKEIQAILNYPVSISSINNQLLILRGSTKKGRYTKLTLALVIDAHVHLLTNGLQVSISHVFDHLQLGSRSAVYAHIRHIKREILNVFENEVAKGLTPTDVSVQAALKDVFPPLVIEHYLRYLFDYEQLNDNETAGQD